MQMNQQATHRVLYCLQLQWYFQLFWSGRIFWLLASKKSREIEMKVHELAVTMKQWLNSVFVNNWDLPLV